MKNSFPFCESDTSSNRYQNRGYGGGGKVVEGDLENYVPGASGWWMKFFEYLHYLKRFNRSLLCWTR